MPVAIDNGFPNLALDLGTEHDQFSISGLFDTCGSLNTGYLPFHAWVASQHPNAVEDFRYFNGDDPFDPIKLAGAVSDTTANANSPHGLLTAVIRYKTPYFDNTQSPISLSFALGNHVATNTIFGLPTITALEFLVDIPNLTAHSRRLDITFQLTKSEGSLGLPAGVSFDPDVHRRIHEAAVASSHKYTNTSGDSHDTQEQTHRVIGQDDCSLGYLRRTLRSSLPP